jgi:hypothetical protein
MIKELLAIHEAKCKAKKKVTKKVVEGQEELDLSELVDKYTDANRMYHWEGSRGVSNFDKLIHVIGYRDLDEFLSENSGCLEAMVEWIKDARGTDWDEKIKAQLSEEEQVEESLSDSQRDSQLFASLTKSEVAKIEKWAKTNKQDLDEKVIFDVIRAKNRGRQNSGEAGVDDYYIVGSKKDLTLLCDDFVLEFLDASGIEKYDMKKMAGMYGSDSHN